MLVVQELRPGQVVERPRTLLIDIDTTQAFLPFVSHIRGIDVSGGMVEEYNQRAQAQNLTPDEMFATQGDLLAAPGTAGSALDSPEFFNFDFAVISLGFHHFEAPATAVQKLVERLKPATGVLLILDWASDDGKGSGHSHGHGHRHEHEHGHGHGHGHGNSHSHGNHDGKAGGNPLTDPSAQTVSHSGFSKEAVEKMFKEAGCADVEYIALERPFKFGGKKAGEEKPLFMVKGRRG